MHNTIVECVIAHYYVDGFADGEGDGDGKGDGGEGKKPETKETDTDPDGGKKPEDGKKEDDKGGSPQSLEELAKTNPDIAKLVNEHKDNAKKLADIKAAQEEENRKKLEDENKWKELSDADRVAKEKAEAEAVKAKEAADKYKSSIEGIVDGMMKQIPEDKRGLVPKDYTPLQQLEFINTNAKWLGVSGGGSKGGAVPPNEEEVNLDEESKLQKEYEELMNKETRTPIEDDKLLQVAKKLKKVRADKTEANRT